MKTRLLVFACAVAYAGGAFLSLGVTAVSGRIVVPQYSYHSRSITRQLQSHVHSHHSAAAASIVAILDDHCKFFVISGLAAAQPAVVSRDDPRFRPCSPTVSDFLIEWSGTPTQAPHDALSRILGYLAL